ncbi:hypothetical protein MY3296_001108 [Beauveria thailandica]
MSQRRRKPSSRHPPDTTDNVAPIGYVLEWTAPQPHHRHRLDTVDNLRSELLGGPPSGVEQLIVLRGGSVLDAGVSEALRNLAGVDGAFIEAFAQQGAPYRRPRGAARWWTARYPEETMTDGGRNVMMRRAALWLSSQVPVLLVDTPLVGEEAEEEEEAEAERKRRRRRKMEAPRLTHQDAATRRSALQHGAAAPRRHCASQLTGPASTVTLDDELASAIDHAQQQVIALEGMLAELVHDRWTARLGALPLDTAARLLWGYAVALERNLDDDNVRRGTRQSIGHVGPAAAAWSELSQRVQLRIQLAAAAAAAAALPPCTPAAAAAVADPESDTRSLDRIAYLGAALLPVSIVAGVLAVEGRYGPGGAQFWVFWVASLVAVAAALGFVCLDRLRLAEVWVEMPTSGGGGGGGVAEAVAGGFVADGDKLVRAASAWRRERLGWGRAMKKVSGYYRMRGARWIRFRKPVRTEEEWKDWKDDVIVVEEES